MVCFSYLSSSWTDKGHQTAYWLSLLGQVKRCNAQRLLEKLTPELKIAGTRELS